MNWSNVKLILVREIRDQLRDRRTLFMIAVLPLLMYPLLGMVFFQIAQFMREHPARVLILGGDELAGLSDLPPLVKNDRFVEGLFDSPGGARLLELELVGQSVPVPTATGGDVDTADSEIRPATAASESLEAALDRVQVGEFDLLVVIPDGFGARLDAFRQAVVAQWQAGHAQGSEGEERAAPEMSSPQIYYNSADEMSQIAYTRVSRVLSQWREKVVENYLADIRLPLRAARPFRFEGKDVAEEGHRDAAVWSKILPFILLIWALTGAFYPAVDVCAGEKERGTLETLLSSPAERSEIVWGKLLTVMIFSVVTAMLNLLSMGVTGTFIIRQLNHLPAMAGSLPLSAPPASAIVWLLIALLPVSALFSALCLALAAFARSTKEGQYYLMPLVLITMPLMMLPMAPGVELNLGNSLIPVTGVVLLLRTMLEGNTMQALLYAPPVVAVTLACCLLAIHWAVDQFNKESVLFRESERFDLRLWVRHLVRDRGETPGVAEAISCFILILLIQFFMNLALPELRVEVFADLAVRIFVSLVVVIALPALLMTLLFTGNRHKTLLLDRLPPIKAIGAAILLAIVIHPVVHSIMAVVQALYPISDAVAAYSQFISGVMTGSPYRWLPWLLIAVLPALCEELAFRGFILSGLRHLGHKWWAIGLSAVFFGVAHGLLQQSIMASILGVVLAYVAVQTSSLLPCILFHLTHNSLLLFSDTLDFSDATYARYPQLLWFFKPMPTGEDGFVFQWPLVMAGAVLAALLLRWFHQLPYQKTAEEELQEALENQAIGPLAEEG
ncbi:MAG: ABC transporter permease subunit/CPBP intramembrane protease [Pirellulales bacterium]